jgi:hypothetical protein
VTEELDKSGAKVDSTNPMCRKKLILADVVLIRQSLCRKDFAARSINIVARFGINED